MARRGCSKRMHRRPAGCWRWRARCSTSLRSPRMPDAALLPSDLAERLLERALRRGGDFADLYVERRSTFSLSLDDRRLERAQSGQEIGASVRVIAGDSTYFAHVD